MNEENSLISQAAMDQLPAVAESKAVDAMLAADAVSFLPYINLLQAMSKLNAPGEDHVDMGNFVLIEAQKPTDLGTEFDLVLLEKRYLAWKYGPECNIRCYDPEDPIVEEIVERSALSKEQLRAENDSNLYSWGVEYLIYIPSLQKFATFHASSKTLRISAAQDFHALVASRPLITWFSKWFDNPKSDFAWFNLQTKECNTGDQYEQMDISLATEVITKFQNPPAIDSVDPETDGETEEQ